jgi:putative CocE/NonD family hydrolase
MMSIASWLIARLAHLPPARTRDVSVERDLRVPMPDGVVLLADRYFPRREPHAPIVLLRSPYGRRSFIGTIGRLYAERGYQAVIQSVRGTFGSAGVFHAMRHEAGDGRATLEWLAAQPWFSGSVAMAGPSYLGMVQWAVAADAPPYLRALAPHITASQFRSLTYPGEAFGLQTGLSWLYQLRYQEQPWWRVLLATVRQRRALMPAFATLPLKDADRVATGQTVAFFQNWLTHNHPGDPYWEEINYSRTLDRVTAPVNMVAGWYDIFLPAQLDDYAALRDAGQQPYLTIGPWIHVSPGAEWTQLTESLAWFDAHLRGETGRLRPLPVRIFVMGAKRWLDLPDWPPPATATRWHLQPQERLAQEPPPDSPPDGYRYDPANPTPSVGGTVLTADAGPRDNRRLEARADVLTYTTAPLERDLEVIGPVSVELYVRSSLEHTDFFARVCDVASDGRSINICDGLERLRPGRFEPDADGVTRVRIELWPTAYCFRAGHRLRLQVSSGAHPRYSRNLGGGEPLATATRMAVAEQRVFHDMAHPSALILPVYAGQAG